MISKMIVFFLPIVMSLFAYFYGKYNGRLEYTVKSEFGASMETLFISFPHSFNYAKLKLHAIGEVKKSIEEARKQNIDFLHVCFNLRRDERSIDFELHTTSDEKILETINLVIDRINYAEKCK